MRSLAHIFRSAHFPFLLGWTDEGVAPRLREPGSAAQNSGRFRIVMSAAELRRVLAAGRPAVLDRS